MAIYTDCNCGPHRACSNCGSPLDKARNGTLIDAHDAYHRHSCDLPLPAYFVTRECVCGFTVHVGPDGPLLWPSGQPHRAHPLAMWKVPTEEETLAIRRWYDDEAKRAGASPIEFVEFTVQSSVEVIRRRPLAPRSIVHRPNRAQAADNGPGGASSAPMANGPTSATEPESGPPTIQRKGIL